MRPDIVTLARTWLGTPYRHQASLKGVGCDCLGLVRGVYADAYGRPAEQPPAYSRDWAEAGPRETMIEGAARHLMRIALEDAQPGDVLIFRLHPGAMAKHCGMLCSKPDLLPAFGPLSSRIAVRDRRGPLEPAGDAEPVARGAGSAKMIHAIEGAPVCEVHLTSWWRRRIAAAFRFPTLETSDAQSLQ